MSWSSCVAMQYFRSAVDHRSKMAGARHLRGTILTRYFNPATARFLYEKPSFCNVHFLVFRVSNLLRSGAIKQKPIWFDVVEAFPPIVSTKINRKPEPGRVDKLEYPEDFFRRYLL